MHSDSLEGDELEEGEELDGNLNKPWKDDPQWSTGVIECSNHGSAIAAWVLCAIVCGIALYVYFKVDSHLDWENINWQNLELSSVDYLNLAMTLGLILVPLCFIIYAIRATIRWKKFGKSSFRLSGETGVIGGTLAGVIQTSEEFQATGDFTLHLECIHSVTTGSGKNRKTRTTTKWEHKQTVSSTRASVRSGVPVSFSIPADCLETDDESVPGTIAWKLTITAPTAGVNYHADFSVPVFRKR